MEWHSGSVIPFLPFSRGGCAEPVLAAERMETMGQTWCRLQGPGLSWLVHGGCCDRAVCTRAGSTSGLLAELERSLNHLLGETI